MFGAAGRNCTFFYWSLDDFLSMAEYHRHMLSEYHRHMLSDQVLRKGGLLEDWDSRLSKRTQLLNGCVIRHLGFSPMGILE